MIDETLMVFVLLVFLFGVITGMALYRVLWHVDTRDMRAEIVRLSNHNRALQDEIFALHQAQDDLNHRLAILEETNRELTRERRAYANR